MKISSPKGTRDFFPEDMHVRRWIGAVWQETARLFGFEEFDGPVFEHLELFIRKSGQEIVDQLYHFKDKSKRDLALRPEITPTLARMVAQKGNALKKPIKWFSVPRLFRYERKQRGRLREFFQFNLDILGEPSVSADAEIVAAAAHMLMALGLTAGDFRICVNSRHLMSVLLHSSGMDEKRIASAYAVLDKRDKVERDVLLKLYKDAGIRKADTAFIDRIFECKTIDEVEERFGQCKGAETAIAELKDFFKRIECYGFADCVVFDAAIVRGLAYYTGIVFEIFDIKKSLRAVAGGGRYDNLVALFGGEKTPATGFGIGDVVLYELLKEKNLLTPYARSTEVYIVNFTPDDPMPVASLAAALRQAGIAAEFALRPLKVKKQMDAAAHARYVVFVGGEEWRNGQVKIKEMSTGKEEVVDKNKAIGELKRNS
jgi:histidyl-tRNA synthetase